MSGYRLACFRFDVTPPLGHALCGGWIEPVTGYDDPLEAIGFVLLGPDAPIVVCAVDWTGILNEAHAAWRAALAAAAGTTADRVAVHCVHQHNAPFVCLETARRVAAQTDLPRMFEPHFFWECLERAHRAVEAALPRARPVTQVAHGEARVEKVASNRRVSRDPQGMVTAMRFSSCLDPRLIALPEGTIDPMLKTIAFFDGETKIAACHYYATHPMSYYRDGRVSSDFCGLARRRRQEEEPRCTHLYFTGCAANVAAGKYNDGTKERRAELAERIYRGMVAAEAVLRPEPLREVNWRTREVLPEPNPAHTRGALEAALGDRRKDLAGRMVPAFELAWIDRLERRIPLLLGALWLNRTAVLHLPAELFVEYQLRAQAMIPHGFVAVAGYGDGGPWYVPTKEEYSKGGYEVSVAFSSDRIDEQITSAMRRLLSDDPRTSDETLARSAIRP